MDRLSLTADGNTVTDTEGGCSSWHQFIPTALFRNSRYIECAYVALYRLVNPELLTADVLFLHQEDQNGQAS